MKKWLTYSLIAGGTTAVVGGAAVGAMLPTLLKAKDGVPRLVSGLQNFAQDPGVDPTKSWTSDKKLNYVALGDSETAGFNGFLQGTPELQGSRDYVSYADFLANSLNKSNNLNSYHNYAVSGATIPDQTKLFTEHTMVHETIKKADLISVSIGANDLLAFIRLLDIPFALSADGIINALRGQVTSLNETRDKIFGSITNTQGSITSNGKTTEQISKTLTESVKILRGMVNSGDFSNIINIEQEFRKVIFDLIRRNIMTFIHDLHLAAPNAEIMVLGHAFPFAQWPSEILNKKRMDLAIDEEGKTPRSISELYNLLIDKMKEGATWAIEMDGTSVNEINNNYTKFFKVDDLVIRKSADGTTETDSRDNGHNKYTDYIKKNDAHTKIDASHPQDNFYVRNAMPNAADIHPSTFGHQLIGNALYDEVGAMLKETPAQTLASYTYSQPYDGIYGTDQNGQEIAADSLTESDGAAYKTAVQSRIGLFERIDENPSLSHGMAEQVSSLLRGENTLVNTLVKFMGPALGEITDWSPLINFFEGSALTNFREKMEASTQTTTFGKVLDVLAKQAQAEATDPTQKGILTSIFEALDALATKDDGAGGRVSAGKELTKLNTVLHAIKPIISEVKDWTPLINILNGSAIEQISEALKTGNGSTLENILGMFSNPSLTPVFQNMITELKKINGAHFQNVVSILENLVNVLSNKTVMNVIVHNLINMLAKPDTTVPKHYTDLNDYYAKVYGIDSTVALDQTQITKWFTSFYGFMKGLATLVKEMQGASFTSDVAATAAGLSDAAILKQVTNSDASHPGLMEKIAPLSAMIDSATQAQMAGQYNSAIEEITKQNPSITFDAKTTFTPADVKTHVIIQNVINAYVGDLMVQVVPVASALLGILNIPLSLGG